MTTFATSPTAMSTTRPEPMGFSTLSSWSLSPSSSTISFWSHFTSSTALTGTYSTPTHHPTTPATETSDHESTTLTSKPTSGSSTSTIAMSGTHSTTPIDPTTSDTEAPGYTPTIPASSPTPYSSLFPSSPLHTNPAQPTETPIGLQDQNGRATGIGMAVIVGTTISIVVFFIVLGIGMYCIRKKRRMAARRDFFMRNVEDPVARQVLFRDNRYFS